ncbi:MAG: cupin domain-containing protein [Deltaproteobacteria bacterium]|nr:cupin domain-containing protein [Deltaproteobacteria bacterium]MBW1812796.1 cupin domain-containing protein [Deltaproteobacteria bacterium]MBW1847033.1 cupin domain-containing protein [Deltaproteobacteria bacterium]MBW2363711.1 cupin domain-containing protein [Deltaproteobacteria bacterium]
MTDTHLKKIGDKLNRTRESMGLTLQQLADISNVVPSTIQKIETGSMIPSIAVMMKIARGLNKKIGFFLDEEETATEVSLLRKSERLSLGEKEDQISVQKLTTELVNPEIDGFILTLPLGTGSGEEPLHHHGEELVFCIRGKATFTVDGDYYTLGPGDTLHFKSKLSHSYKNLGRSTVELLIIYSVPALSEKVAFLNVSRRTEDEKDNQISSLKI